MEANTEHELQKTVRSLDDADLAKELSFAEGFEFEDHNGRLWLAFLQQEATRRTASTPQEGQE